MKKKNIFVIIAKSACGKDVLYHRLMKTNLFKKIILYYTREMRPGEKNGETYFFLNDDEMGELLKSDKIIASEVYPVANSNGVTIALVDDEQFNGEGNFLAVMSWKFFKKMLTYFSKREDVNIIPIYIDVSYKERMIRYMKREKEKANPNFEEVCRRFIVDEEDFPQNEIEAIIPKENKFENYDLEEFFQKVLAFVKDKMN